MGSQSAMNTRTSSAKRITYYAVNEDARWTIRSPAAAATDGCKDAARSSQMLLPQQLAVWRRDAFWVERTEVPEQFTTTYRTPRCIRVFMQVPKLRHEQRPEVPELMKTLL